MKIYIAEFNKSGKIVIKGLEAEEDPYDNAHYIANGPHHYRLNSWRVGKTKKLALLALKKQVLKRQKAIATEASSIRDKLAAINEYNIQ